VAGAGGAAVAREDGLDLITEGGFRGAEEAAVKRTMKRERNITTELGEVWRQSRVEAHRVAENAIHLRVFDGQV